MRRHIGHGLLAGVLLVVTSCGPGEPVTAPTVTVPVTVSPTDVTTTVPTSTTASETTAGIEVAIPGRDEPIVIITPDDSERRVAEDTTTDLISDGPEELGMEPISEEHVHFFARFVVVGEVASIEGPFWNQADGQKWTAEAGVETVPGLYREVTLEVEQVVADPLGVIGDSIEFLVRGGGTQEEYQPWLGGRFTEGERVAVFLDARAWFQREDRLLALQPYASGGRDLYHLVERGGEVLRGSHRVLLWGWCEVVGEPVVG